MEKIAADFESSDRRLIELFDLWIERSVDCNWFTVTEALFEMNERSLAVAVSCYIEEVTRINQIQFQKCCVGLAPLKDSCFNDEELKKMYFETDKLARESISGSRTDVIECLIPRSSKWYEIGVMMGVPKAKLDEIEARHKSQGPSVLLIKMVDTLIEVFSFKCTWRKVIDGLLEMNFTTVAQSVTTVALKKCGLSEATMTCKLEHRDFTRGDFVSSCPVPSNSDAVNEEKIRKHFEKICGILCIPSLYVSDEDILERLYTFILSRDPSETELETVMKSVEGICQLASKQQRKVASQAEKLKIDLTKVENVRGQLNKEKRQLEISKGKLEDNSQEISDEIAVVKKRDEREKLVELEMRHEKVQEQLREVCRQLNTCIQKLREADADYDSINDQLTICRKNLYTCKRQLKGCDKHMQNEDTGIALNPEVKEAVGEALVEIEGTYKTIADIQVILDSADQPVGDNYTPSNCSDASSLVLGGKYMQILVDVIPGCSISLAVQQSDTVDSVKAKIEDEVDISSDKYCLWFSNKQLQDEHILSDYDMYNNSTLHLVLHRPEKNLLVKTTFRMIIFLKEIVGCNTVSDIKCQIQDKEGIPPASQCLMFSGRVLEVGHTVSYYNIQNESTLHLSYVLSDEFDIFVRTISGKTAISLTVVESDTIGDVKCKIQDEIGILPLWQHLIYGDGQLKDGCTLSDCKIKSDSMLLLVLRLPCDAKLIYVKPPGKTNTLVIKESDTVADIKSKIQETSPVSQHLCYDGKKLEDGHTLSDYNIQSESTLDLVVNPICQDPN